MRRGRIRILAQCLGQFFIRQIEIILLQVADAELHIDRTGLFVLVFINDWRHTGLQQAAQHQHLNNFINAQASPL